MEKEYTIRVKGLEYIAYLWALLATTPGGIIDGDSRPIHFDSRFPGGISAARKVKHKIATRSGEVYDQIRGILEGENITRTSAPWLKTQAPTEIDGNAVEYKPDGIKVGCQNLSLAEMEEMVKKCKGAE